MDQIEVGESSLFEIGVNGYFEWVDTKVKKVSWGSICSSVVAISLN